MDKVIILSFFVPIITSYIVLTEYNTRNRILISITCQILEIFIGAIISVLSIILMGILEINLKIDLIRLDVLYFLGCILAQYVSTFYCYCINLKARKKHSTLKLFLNFIIVTIISIIIISTILIFIIITTQNKIDWNLLFK